MNKHFWKGKKVFITGHTGFKGGWLAAWLKKVEAIVCGYALKPKTKDNFFQACNISKIIDSSIIGDILDYELLEKSLNSFQPEIVFHLAAQPLVIDSYKDPLYTYNVNVIGAANLLNILRNTKSIKSIINITSDKCYENKNLDIPFNEEDAMGGHDPYSSSKGCSELLTNSFYQSFFKSKQVGLASVRAGNVIGGGDWSENRLIPDCIKSIYENENFVVRNPKATRPWQHVLDPLHGYIILSENLYYDTSLSGPWNFGPSNNGDQKNVKWILDKFIKYLDLRKKTIKYENSEYYEAKYLKLDCNKANSILKWIPLLDLETSLIFTSEWYKNFYNKKDTCLNFTMNQIELYERMKK